MSRGGWNRNVNVWDRNPWENRPNSGQRGGSPSFRGRGRGGGFSGNNQPWQRDSNRRGRGNFGHYGGGRGGGRNRGNYDSRDNDRWRSGGNYNDPYRSAKYQNALGKRLSEADIGVTEFMTTNKGFNGIIKQRYSDFQVNEINLQGEVAKLTDMSVPSPPKGEEICEDEELVLSKYNLEILPMETWDKINSLVVSTEPITDKVEVDVTGLPKERRTKIHEAVKKAFGDAIVGKTVTVEDDQKKFCSFEKYRKGVRVDNRKKWSWPGDYVHFIVHKENCDTMEASSRIVERMNSLRFFIKPSFLGYAGTKDRRAKTSQWFSIRRMEPRRIAQACTAVPGVYAGNYTFSKEHLKLGMLKGNRFRIVLRNVKAEDDVVQKSIEDLKELGFINYYGLQRFGTRFNTPTYGIGLKILQGNYKEAINDILEVYDAGPMSAALQKYKSTGNASEAAQLIKRKFCKTPEGCVLRSLARDPKDLVGALQSLPRNARLLYVHSYQSLVWNRCVSERIRRLGLKPAVGDLVPEHPVDQLEDPEDVLAEESDDEDSKPEFVRKSESEATESSKKVEENTETIDKPDGNTEATETETETKESNGSSNEKVSKKVAVKALTQEDIDSGEFTLFDIIMPLPGYDIDYPENMKDYYEEVMKKDDITLDMKHKIKSFHMSGAYRHVAVRPEGLEWSSVQYNSPTKDLILSDYEEFRGRTVDNTAEGGQYKAVLLTMSLPSSCYATMALRELLKADTSTTNQAKQNNYHEENKAKSEEQKSDSEKDEKVTPSKAEDDSVKAELEADVNMESDSVDDSVNKAESDTAKIEAEKRKIDDDSEEEVELKKTKTD